MKLSFGIALNSLLCLIITVLPTEQVAGSEPAIITETDEPIILGPHMFYIEDKSTALDFETIRSLRDTEQPELNTTEMRDTHWVPVDDDNIIGGFTSSAYWVRFTVQNVTQETKHWKLEINYPLLDHIELYSPDGSGGYVKSVAGDKFPFSERPIDYRNFLFPLQTEAGIQETYYLRVKTDSSMFIDLWIWPGDSLTEDIDGMLILYGFIYGIVFLGSIYCLVNWAFQGKIMYLNIALGILGSMGYLIGINGFGFQYLWPNNLWMQEVAVPFFMAACFGFALLYSREFLELPRTSPTSDKVISYFARACLALSLASLVVSYAVIIRISTVFAILTAFAALWAGVISYLRGNRFARFYMVGWSAVIIGATTFALKSLGLVPANTFTIWSQEFGFACVSIFLTMALSDHFFQAQREHSEQQAKSIKAIKTAEKKYRSLFENAIEGIFQMDIDGQLINVNKAFANILGFADVPRLLEQKPAPFSLNCLNETDRLRFTALLEQDKPKTNFQTSITLEHGEERWVSISLQKIKSQDEDVSHYEGAMADITETKKREQAEKQQRMAEASTEAKSLFLANMSHEIRTPMNAIIGFTDLALGRNTDKQLAEYLQKTRMASSNLLGIINDILDFSKIEAGKLEIENTPFSLQEVFNNLSNIVSANVESKNLTLKLDIDEDIPDKLVGDPLRIGQVLLNLTNNAIKFTAEGVVAVELELVNLNKPEMTIDLCGRVRDTGIGIPEEKLKTLFSSFTQADDSTTRRFGGTGLGLSISKQLIEMMGGELWVESVVGEGSTFHFKFSCNLQDRRQRRNPHFSSNGGPLNILVVDDQQESRTLIEQAVLSLAHNVVCVTNSGEAIIELKAKQAEGNPYDVLIADWLMPDVDGITCCQMIKEDPDIHTPRTIIVTGYDQDEARQKAERIGVDSYMLKPVRVDDLEKVLTRVFHDRRAPVNTPKRMPDLTHFQGMRVLLVEDVSMNQELAIEILSRKGIQVSVANNGQEGVDALKKETFDLVLMDMQMPIMDGCQATQIIRETEQKLPIIAMTANAMAGDKQRCLAAGMNDYITKPINADELFMAIGKWTGALTQEDHKVVFGDDQNNGKTHQAVEAEADTQNESFDHLPKSLPGVDIKEGVDRCQGNDTLYLRFLSDFVKDYADTSEILRNSITDQDFRNAADLAHKVKGLAANLGAKPLAEVSGELQQVKDASFPSLDTKLDRFEQELNIFLDSIEKILQRQESNQQKLDIQKTEQVKDGTNASLKGALSLEKCKAHLEALLPLIKRQKLEAQHQAEGLLRDWPDDTQKDALQNLVDALDRFDFQEAEKLLTAILKDSD